MSRVEGSPIYAMRKFANFSARFPGVGRNLSISRGIREFGAGHALHSRSKTYEMDGLVFPFTVPRVQCETYRIDECVSKIGGDVLFF